MWRFRSLQKCYYGSLVLSGCTSLNVRLLRSLDYIWKDWPVTVVFDKGSWILSLQLFLGFCLCCYLLIPHFYYALNTVLVTKWMSSSIVCLRKFCQINFPKTYLFPEGSLVLQIVLTEQTLNILAMISRPPYTSVPADFSVIPPQNSLFWLRKFTYCFLREISSSMYFHIKCFYLGYTIPPNCQLCKFLASFFSAYWLALLCASAGNDTPLLWILRSPLYSLHLLPYIKIGISILSLHYVANFFPQLPRVYRVERVWRIHWLFPGVNIYTD